MMMWIMLIIAIAVLWVVKAVVDMIKEGIKMARELSDEESFAKKAREKVKECRDFDCKAELDKLVGLESVKSEVEGLQADVKYRKALKRKGVSLPPFSYHLVFAGRPGTGKTTVARIIAHIYCELKILKTAKFVEASRQDLVAEYIGQTAKKTNSLIDEALDGVLFIDEAYSLVGKGPGDYGEEAIETLLKRMEDDRDRLVVIVAGYNEEMKNFINSNPGLMSRFKNWLYFEDYTSDQMMEIFRRMSTGLTLTLAAERSLKEYFDCLEEDKPENFANARDVRNLFEKIIRNRAKRYESKTKRSPITTITGNDIPVYRRAQAADDPFGFSQEMMVG